MTTDDGETGFLRDLQSYGDRDFSIYMRRAFARSQGWSLEELGRPIIGIAFTHSRFNPCHRHFPELLEAVKRGMAVGENRRGKPEDLKSNDDAHAILFGNGKQG